jgi:type I restriction enzyme R subunit
MPTDHREKGFEEAIEHVLTTSGGYRKGVPAAFNATLGLTTAEIVAFLKDTQPKAWERLAGFYGADVEGKVVQLVAKSLDQRGTLDVLRHGITDRGVSLRLAYFRPATTMNADTLALYGKNILTITRQVHYSVKEPEKSIDAVLSLNGLPVATVELKNPFTGQNVGHAKRQYQNDRDPGEALLRFKIRALVHFAVDPDLVYMTTRLAGGGTRFLPFNVGDAGGAGNPLNNATGWRTAYLWEDVLPRDSWLDVLARFIHIEVREEERDGQTIRKESVIFPRYHQLTAVRKLIDAAQTEGAGHNYLIQHSAGSGKSNTIAWTAHRLASLHDAKDGKVFDTVIVVTDRRVLDKQLQDTIYQFEHKQGVVKKIDTDTAQLVEAVRTGSGIIITTLQKFPFFMGQLRKQMEEEAKATGKGPGSVQEAMGGARRYAIIVDEAHSSQSGESASQLRQVLSAATLEEAEKQQEQVEAQNADPADEIEDEILKTIKGRGPQKNLSFFAFTATPKHKTLEVFGRDGPDGKPKPFHLYSMRQAIEEEFILDVLKNYTTYSTYFRLAKGVQDDPELDKKKATTAAVKYVSLHPHNLAQKTEIIIEHFRAFTRHKIGGRAKAMVVTRSRLHAVRYKQEVDRYIREKGYDRGVNPIKTLVAFSGTVKHEGLEFTEPGMNGFGEKELPKKFEGQEYSLLIVAEKYQTGFDQPLLHTMYVDKRLKGLQAVQTLSRLNRTCAGKEDTFVLDFCNTVEDIREGFKPYFEATEIEERVDPNLLYSLKTKLDSAQVYWQQEVTDFARVFFKPAEKQREADKGMLHKHINPAVERFKGLPEDKKEEFRGDLATFVRLYSFLCHIVTFQDPDLERLYVFARLLLTRLPQRTGGGSLVLDDEVRLAYYRANQTFVGSASLEAGDGLPVSGPTEVGTGGENERERARLSEIIQTLNDRFQTDFTDADRLLFDQVVADLKKDTDLAQQARENDLEQFKLAFDPKALAALVDRVERNEGISSQLMSNEAMRAVVLTWMRRQVFEASKTG